MKKIYYPDRFQVSKLFILTLVLMAIGIGLATKFSNVFLLFLFFIALDLFIMSQAFRLVIDLDKQTISGFGPGSLTITRTIPVDKIQIEENGKNLNKLLFLNETGSKRSIMLNSEIFNEQTINEIKSVIKNKAFLTE